MKRLIPYLAAAGLTAGLTFADDANAQPVKLDKDCTKDCGPSPKPKPKTPNKLHCTQLFGGKGQCMQHNVAGDHGYYEFIDNHCIGSESFVCYDTRHKVNPGEKKKDPVEVTNIGPIVINNIQVSNQQYPTPRYVPQYFPHQLPIQEKKSDVKVEVVPMAGYDVTGFPEYGTNHSFAVGGGLCIGNSGLMFCGYGLGLIGTEWQFSLDREPNTTDEDLGAGHSEHSIERLTDTHTVDWNAKVGLRGVGKLVGNEDYSLGLSGDVSLYLGTETKDTTGVEESEFRRNGNVIDTHSVDKLPTSEEVSAYAVSPALGLETRLFRYLTLGAEAGPVFKFSEYGSQSGIRFNIMGSGRFDLVNLFR